MSNRNNNKVITSAINGQPPLPSGFLSCMEEQLQDLFPKFLSTYDQPPVRAIRLRNKPTPSVMPSLTYRVPWTENAYYLKEDVTPGSEVLHEAGAYYIQDASAMAPAAALSPHPGETVLDLCAAPGGKATQLGTMLAGKGCLVANEPHPARAKILSRNIERMGIINAAVTVASPDLLASKWPEQFDCILVDAPCSGEGMFRKNPLSRLEWSSDSPEICAKRQNAILDAAALMLKPGGRIAYSTCTFNRVENENVIEHFLSTHPRFELLPFSLPGLPSAQNGMLRLWPHEIRGEGHFVALMVKSGFSDSSVKRIHEYYKKKSDVQAALSLITDYIPNCVTEWKNIEVCPPETDLCFDAIPLLRFGLHLGTFRGKQFVPDHALALTARAKHQFEISDSEARLFLHGDVLSMPSDAHGWFSPVLDSFQLGWGKASEGQLKNHYPKGLRK